MAAIMPLLKAEDLWRLSSDLRCELIDGVLIEMSPPGPEHAGIALTIGSLVNVHVRARNLGRVLGEAGFILRRDPDTVRAPDVAFVRADRIPPTGLPKTFWEFAPDLSVEVVSPNDTPTEVQAKVREWIEAGVRLVWVVDPSTRTVNVIRSLRDRVTLAATDVLDGGEVLSGFSCRVSEVFE